MVPRNIMNFEILKGFQSGFNVRFQCNYKFVVMV